MFMGAVFIRTRCTWYWIIEYSSLCCSYSASTINNMWCLNKKQKVQLYKMSQ